MEASRRKTRANDGRSGLGAKGIAFFLMMYDSQQYTETYTRGRNWGKTPHNQPPAKRHNAIITQGAQVSPLTTCAITISTLNGPGQWT